MYTDKITQAVAEAVKQILATEKLHPNQQKLDVHEPEKDELTSNDFKMLRKGKKADVKEGWQDMLDDVKKRAGPQPSGGSGVKQGSRYGGSKQKDEPEDKKPMKEEFQLQEEVEIQEAEALVENFEIINEVSLGAKIRAYASHSGNAFAHDDMGNDKEYKHHSVKADKIIAHIEKHHGKEAVKHAERAAHSQIFGHPDHEHSGEDRLSGGLRGNKNLTKAGKVPKNTVSAMKNKIMAYGKHRNTAGPKAKLPEEVDINAINGVKMSNVDESSHQAKTTMKHIPNASPELKKAAKDIKPGIAGFRDRVAMLKAGGVKQ